MRTAGQTILIDPDDMLLLVKVKGEDIPPCGPPSGRDEDTVCRDFFLLTCKLIGDDEAVFPLGDLFHRRFRHNADAFLFEICREVPCEICIKRGRRRGIISTTDTSAPNP